ncbi:MAG TPA: hypothetical protein VNO55_22000, partial [Polyangia bacterium]|nr:hypothetical protein [Polyangia bacterium]
ATVSRGDDGPPPATTPAGEPAAVTTTAPAPTAEPTPVKAILFPRAADGRADVRGFSFGFVADRARRVHGVQLAIGWAQTDQELVALQLAAGANLVQGSFEGAQLAAGANMVRGQGRGLQLVGGANVVDGDFRGVQVAGGADVTTGSMVGVQLAGGAGVVEQGRGLQVAGGINLAKTFTGMQLAPFNYAESLHGLQLGVVNAAGESHGFRFGVVNIARHDDGESFALINLIGNGIHDLSLFASDVMVTNVGLKLGGRHLYTNLIAGYQPGDALAAGPERFTAGTKRFATGAGIGWRFPVQRGPLAYAELEADWLQVRPAWRWTDDAPSMGSLRAQAGFALAPHLVLLAGAGVNVAVATDGRDLDLGRSVPQSVNHSGATTVRIYPGLLLGLQI